MFFAKNVTSNNDLRDLPAVWDSDLVNLLSCAKGFLDKSAGIKSREFKKHLYFYFKISGLWLVYFIFFVVTVMVTIALPWLVTISLFLLVALGRGVWGYSEKSAGQLQRSAAEETYERQSDQLQGLLTLLKMQLKNKRGIEIINPTIGNSISESFMQIGKAFDALTKSYQKLKTVPPLTEVEKIWNQKYLAWAGFLSSSKKAAFLKKQTLHLLTDVLYVFFKKSQGCRDICSLLAAYCVPDFDLQVSSEAISFFEPVMV